MSVQVTILPRQLPTRLREDQIRSLRLGRVDYKHHYEAANQVQQWITLHKTYSPSRTKSDCKVLFDQCFTAASRTVGSSDVHVVGLGAGDGTKEQRLIRVLNESGRRVIFSPVDVGVAMVLEARERDLNEIPAGQCAPIVCDVANEPALLTALDEVLSTLHLHPWVNNEYDEAILKIARSGMAN